MHKRIRRGVSASLTAFTRTESIVTAKLPPRRLLAVAAALALIGRRPMPGILPPPPAIPAQAARCRLVRWARSTARPARSATRCAGPTRCWTSTTRARNRPRARATSRHRMLPPGTWTAPTARSTTCPAMSACSAPTSCCGPTRSTTTSHHRLRRPRQRALPGQRQLLSASHMQGNTSAEHASADDVRYQLLQSRGNGAAGPGHPARCAAQPSRGPPTPPATSAITCGSFVPSRSR